MLYTLLANIPIALFHSFYDFLSLFTLFCWNFRNSSAGHHHTWSAPFLINSLLWLVKNFSSPGAFVVALFVHAAAPLSKRVHTMTASHDHDRDMTTWWNSAVFWRKVLVMQRPGSQRRRVVWRHCWCPPGRVPFTDPLRAVFVWCNVRKSSWTSVNFEKVKSFEHNIALLRFVSYGPNLWYHNNSLWPPFYSARYKKKTPSRGQRLTVERRWRVKRRRGKGDGASCLVGVCPHGDPLRGRQLATNNSSPPFLEDSANTATRLTTLPGDC